MAKIKIYQHEKRKILYALLITFILLAILVIFADFSFNVADFTSVSENINDIENALKNGTSTEGYVFALIGTDGVVKQSSMSDYAVGASVDLDEVSALHGVMTNNNTYVYYTKPYSENGVQTGTILARFNMNKASGQYVIVSGALALAVGIPLVVVLALVIVQYINFQKKTEAPIKQLHAALLELVKGNYDKPVELDRGNEDLAMAFHDVELLRQELQKNRNEEKVFREKEKTLLVSLTHDLKTPLSVVSGCAECIRDGIPEGEITFADRILAHTSKMTGLIDQIIESTRVEMTEFTVECKDVDAVVFFKKELKQARQLAGDKEIDLDAEEIPKVTISVDEFRISQVFQNVFGNAVKYTDKGGKILVEFAEQDKFLKVTVRDTGVGIPPEDLPFVFDKFYRSEKARNHEGNGLGLSIAKTLVEKHGGTISCNSVWGEGTVVSFTVKIA